MDWLGGGAVALHGVLTMASKIHLWDSSGTKILTSGGRIAFKEDCCCGCPEYADSFTRTDSTDLGADWTEVAGNWEIKSNQLYEPGNSGAIALYDKTVRTNYMSASIKIKNEALGGVYRLYIAWADGSNHILATYHRWAYDSGTNPNSDWATLSLHSVVGGVSTELDSTDFQLLEPSLSPRGFTVCMDYSILLTSVDDPSLCHAFYDPVAVANGYQAAVGHGNASEVYYDDWSLIEAASETYPDCPVCWDCGCADRLPPRRLLVTYDGEGVCDAENKLDGISCELGLTKCGADAIARYDGTVNDGSCLDGLDITIRCGGKGQAASAWELTIDETDAKDGLGCGSGLITNMPADSSSTCNPFLLVFEIGPEEVVGDMCNSNCWPCGQSGGADPPYPILHYYIYVTEAP